jgi:hypothetical protein
MRQHEGHWHMDLPDLIRMNQLVRGRIDYAAFEAWHQSLPHEQQNALLHEIFVCALQAGTDDSTVAEALTLSGLPADDVIVRELTARQSNGFPDWDGLFRIHASTDNDERLKALRFCVHHFGVAEGRVFRNESKDWCNHWWHRDLLDERVVQSLLGNPAFYMTSMKDDDKIKKR